MKQGIISGDPSTIWHGHPNKVLCMIQVTQSLRTMALKSTLSPPLTRRDARGDFLEEISACSYPQRRLDLEWSLKTQPYYWEAELRKGIDLLKSRG